MPPWHQLYHWRTLDIDQEYLPWSLFFDIDSIKTTTPVLELHEFLEVNGLRPLDVQVTLQNYPGLSDPNHDWSDNWDVANCIEPIKKKFWSSENLTAITSICVSFQGPSTLLVKIINDFQPRTIMFNHAEVTLHEYYGGQEYWLIRKSMQFSKNLINIAKQFKENHLKDNYLCAHLRRRDFLFGRPKEVPTIEWAAKQIFDILRSLKEIQVIFVSTDAPDSEVRQLKKSLEGYRVLKFEANKEILRLFKDGGVAIIDQIICSRAKFFVGTHESTFSFRIQEEREILGYAPETTFNRLCGNGKNICSQPSKWRLVN
ncbi:GDP-fucose protein O-fucosyltransferase 2 isoform X2 [Adelges cooleyi]|nr:GDP-fucose protein O-fucosyltransferase 2 isoform X2 [Adelges cooleyi]XP_050429339.1 GDP-fucose protein O-fucosyltransferase 2 isoform X2 [Adelges cooleyi]